MRITLRIYEKQVYCARNSKNTHIYKYSIKEIRLFPIVFFMVNRLIPTLDVPDAVLIVLFHYNAMATSAAVGTTTGAALGAAASLPFLLPPKKCCI